jgi:hypothetical protein
MRLILTLCASAVENTDIDCTAVTGAAAKFLIVAAVGLGIIAAFAGDWLVVVAMVLVSLGQLAVLRRRP